MIKVMFVCHGNICRSPMAEFVLRDLAEKRGVGHLFQIASSATSREEIGNPVHHGTRNKLAPLGISVAGKQAVQLTKADYEDYDYLFCMDANNVRNALRLLGGDPLGKIRLLLDLTPSPRDIADPWYTGNFDATYTDIVEGCQALLTLLIEGHTMKK